MNRNKVIDYEIVGRLVDAHTPTRQFSDHFGMVDSFLKEEIQDYDQLLGVSALTDGRRIIIYRSGNLTKLHELKLKISTLNIDDLEYYILQKINQEEPFTGKEIRYILFNSELELIHVAHDESLDRSFTIVTSVFDVGSHNVAITYLRNHEDNFCRFENQPRLVELRTVMVEETQIWAL